MDNYNMCFHIHSKQHSNVRFENTIINQNHKCSHFPITILVIIVIF